MTTKPAEPCALCLVVEAGPPALDRLRAVLPSLPVATVYIAAAADRALEPATTAPLLDFVQANDTAAVLIDDAALARTLQADGCHLSARPDVVGAFEEARDILGNGRIIGAAAGKSRDAAMTLGEIGADYVAFGAPATLRDRPKGRAVRREMVNWWAELFEVPCIAFDVTTADEAADLADAGADFIALTVADGLSPADSRHHVDSVLAALSRKASQAVP